MIKKFLMFLLSITVLLSEIPIFAAESENIHPNEYTGLLKQINVFDDEDNLEAMVTRAEFAGYIARILGIDEYTRNEERYFTDVPATYWKSNSINGLASQGIISGGGDSTFRPNDDITYSEAATILIKAMGYDAYAKLYGGYPDGYIKEAAELKISSGVKIDSKGLSKLSVARLLYNALDTVVLKESGSNINGIQYDKTEGYTFLYKYKSIRKETGLVTAINGISLTGKNYPNENEVVISDSVYEAEDGYVKQFLGKKVNYYYIDDEDNGVQTIIYMYDRGNSQVIKIDSENLETFDADKNILQYYDGSRKKSVRITSGAEFILNGSKTAVNVSEILNNINLGQITVYDMDNDGSCEAVVCEVYEIGVVRSNETENNKIYAKYLDGQFINKDDYDIVKVYSDLGDKIDFSDIKKDDVISVIRSDGYLEIHISRQTVTGKIESVADDSVTIDGVKYSVNKYIKEKHNLTFFSGTVMTLKLNHTGYIVDIKSEISDGMEYAYLRRTYRDEREDFYLRLFTFDKDFKDFSVANKVKVDGKTYKSDKLEEAIYKNKEERPMLIRYNINEAGEITQIDTPSTPKQRDPKESEDSLTITLESSRAYYYRENSLIGSKNIITDDTIVVIVPNDEDIKTSGISKFSVGNRSLLGSNYYEAETYQIGNEKNYEDILLIKSNNSYSINNDSPVILVDDVYTTLNEDDETVIGIDGYKFTQKVNYTMNPEEFPDILIEEGDLIRVEADSYGEIRAVESFYKYKNGTPIEQWGSPTINNFGDYYNATSGWAVNLKDNIIKFGYYDCENPSEAYLLNTIPNVTYFDGKRAWVAPSTEIITGEMNPFSPDMIIKTAIYASVQYIYIYRTAE